MIRIDKIGEDYGDYLRDESRSTGSADEICFPKTQDEVAEAVKYARDNGLRIFVQGARTGLAAGAVPSGGLVINLSRMNRVLGMKMCKDGNIYIRVQPGVILSQLNRMIDQAHFHTDGWDGESLETLAAMKPSSWIFPPDPTETTATVGGMASCNASGAKTYHYGPTRNYVEGFSAVLSDGDVMSLRRGEVRFSGRDACLTTRAGRRIEAVLPDYETPSVKSAAGYYIRKDMDAVDLFIGSEGTLGIFTELEIKLVPAPKVRVGITSFFPDLKKALMFVRRVRGENTDPDIPAFPHDPLAIEFFDNRALGLLRTQQQVNPAFSQLQPLPEGDQEAVYCEFGADGDEEAWEMISALGDEVVRCGGDERNTWVAIGSQQMEKLRFFRHACPECVNIQIDQSRKTDSRITKLGTDMSVRNSDLEWSVEMYERDLESLGLFFVKFGHIGQNHLHVNVIPRSMDEYAKAKGLYLKWAQRISERGGSVAAEHGIGKLKVPFLEVMLGEKTLEEMYRLKASFDPEMILSPGNIFSCGEKGGRA